MPQLPGAAFRKKPAPTFWTSLSEWFETNFECCVVRNREDDGERPKVSLELEGSSQSLCRSRMIVHHPFCKPLLDVYDVEDDVLGHGGFGSVRRARFKQSESWSRVVKSIRKSDSSQTLVQKEIGIIRKLDHPCICRLYETFEDDSFVYLVMEYIEGKELFDYILEADNQHVQLDEAFICSVMKQVFSALQYCHVRSVVHRDLKPENIMADRVPSDCHLSVKLIDFGLATVTKHFKGLPRSRSSDMIAGAQQYVAPEAQQGGKFVPASDMWSAGLVLHILLIGQLPQSDVISGNVPFTCFGKEYEHVVPTARTLLCGLLEREITQRMDAEDALTQTSELGYSIGRTKTPQPALDVVSILTVFHKSNKLRKAALTAVAMHTASQHLTKLEVQFLKADTDGNGKLSRGELEALVSQSDISVDAPAFVQHVFDSIDTDGSNKIEYTEWLAAGLELGQINSESAVRAAFNVFDVDGNGTISVKELARFMLEAPDEIASLIPQFDTNGDGELDIEEFHQLLIQQPRN